MGQALYRKYRSKSFGDVVGQQHVTDTLSNAIKSGRISHAYLFTGPRGVGKTSVARILAHEVNDLPYDSESTHLDIIEIDAASNRRIDEIRDLREKVHISPTSAKYKVYIIDEVHMLTREAFNALLKTLEEPPAHCIFVLATTEAHKLPETIISRTQRFSFKPIKGNPAVKRLADVARKEKIKVSEEVLELIVEHGEGSFRDSLGMLDQLSSLYEQIDIDSARSFLGLPPDDAISGLSAAISDGDGAKVLLIIDSLKEHGSDAAKVASLLASELRGKLISGQSDKWIPQLLRQLIEVPASHNPFSQLEISLLEAAASNGQPETRPSEVATASSQPVITKKPEINKPKEKPQAKGSFDLALWPQVIDQVKSEAASVYTALRLAKPRLEGNKLILGFQFALHQKKVGQAKNIDVVGRCIETISGSKIHIECELIPAQSIDDANGEIEVNSLAAKPANSIDAISNIFGSAEVLES